MKFQIDNKIMIKALETILMKGKYKKGDSTEIRIISEYVYIDGSNPNNITLFNANHYCGCSLNVITPVVADEKKSFIVEAEKAIKYLKTFSGEVSFTFGDSLVMRNGTRQATLPLVTDHPAVEMMTRLLATEVADGFPTVGKTKLETKVVVNSENLVDAIKGCSATNTGDYKLNYDGETFKVSSSRRQESYTTSVEMMTHEGDSSTLVIAQPFHKFLDGISILYMRDDSPLYIIGTDRKIVLAPSVDI
jgi:hypothetical protein